MKIINVLKYFPVSGPSGFSSICFGESPYFADLVLYKLNVTFFINSFGLMRLLLNFAVRLLLNKS